jgi:hypothetical protein
MITHRVAQRFEILEDGRVNYNCELGKQEAKKHTEVSSESLMAGVTI